MSKIKDFASFEINKEKAMTVQGKGFVRCGTVSPSTTTLPTKGETTTGFDTPERDDVYYCPVGATK